MAANQPSLVEQPGTDEPPSKENIGEDTTIGKLKEDDFEYIDLEGDDDTNIETKKTDKDVADEVDGPANKISQSNAVQDAPDAMDGPANKSSQDNGVRDAQTDVTTLEANGNQDLENGMNDVTDGNADLESAKDEVDRASIFSFYMDKDFRYFFQHPYLRLIVVYLVTFCNFLIYAEDPVAHSYKECTIPVVGNCFSFVCTKYPSNAWSVLKVFLWILAITCGLFSGKFFVHKFLFNKLFRLKMFANDQGSWMSMFFTTIIVLFVFSHLYNAFLMIGGESTEPYRITSYMGIRNSWFMKAAATGTWCGDFFTAWMVTDIMLQEKLHPKWAKPVRKWWNTKYNRIILFWIVTVVTSMVVVMVISTNWIKWDTLNRDFVTSSEMSRAFLASFILVMDLLIVMQDWDFPHFINNFDIKLPGLNTADIKFHIPKCLIKEHWIVHITGKWFNYGIIFIVMLLDLNMWKNQIFYSPFEYGQYVDIDDRIHSVRDEYTLENHNETYLNYDWRNNNTNPRTNRTYVSDDFVMNSRYQGYGLALKAMAFIPCIVAIICFGILIWYFGRWKPEAHDPHAGRLKKRRRQWRFSKRGSGRDVSNPSLIKMKMFRNNVSSVSDGKNYVVFHTDDNSGYPQNWDA